MFQGPYNTPVSLGRAPIAAVFWPIIAPILFLNVGVLLAGFLTQGWVLEQFEEGGSPPMQWLILLVIQAILFAAMSFWSDRAGAGPFAGSLKIESDWIGIAALTGPLVLLGSTLLIGILVSRDDPNWMFRDPQANPLLTRDAIGLSMIAAGGILIPITEEMAFRGIALGFLLNRGLTPLSAGVVTAVVFAALHPQYTLLGMVPVFIMGLYLAWLRIATGSITAPIVAHMSANLVSLTLFIAANAS
ncbi:MAG: type II CAAX endopeptidase family protein [Pseudomonadota bacterium]